MVELFMVEMAMSEMKVADLAMIGITNNDG